MDIKISDFFPLSKWHRSDLIKSLNFTERLFYEINQIVITIQSAFNEYMCYKVAEVELTSCLRTKVLKMRF